MHIRPTDITALRNAAYSGQALHDEATLRVDAINADPGAPQVLTLPISAADGEDTFDLAFAGIGTFSHTTTSGASTPTLAAAELAAAWNADPDWGGFAAAIPNGVNLILIALAIGASLPVPTGTASGGGAWNTFVETAEAEPAAIPFGSVVIEVDAPAGGPLALAQYKDSVTLYGAAPSTATVPVTAATVTFGGTFDTSETVKVWGRVGDVEFSAKATASAEDDVGDALAAELTAYDDLTVTYDDSTDVLSIAGPAGKALEVYAASLKAASTFTATAAVSAAGVNIDDLILGVAQYSHDTDTDTIGTFATGYKPGLGLKAISNGPVWVACDDSPSASDPVYVGLDGAERGKVYKTGSSTRALSKKLVRRGVANTSLSLIDVRK